MSQIINQGEQIDEYGLRYEVLTDSATGKVYHAYRWDDLQVRAGCLARVGLSGQPQRYPVLDKQAVAEPAPQG